MKRMKAAYVHSLEAGTKERLVVVFKSLIHEEPINKNLLIIFLSINSFQLKHK